LVVHGSGPVRALPDLVGRRAGWVDPWSAAGYLYPRRMLRDAGLDPSTVFSKQKFYGSHPAVLAALREGEIDVGATYLDRTGQLRRLDGNEVTDLGPLGRTAAIPSDALCLSDQVDEIDVAVIRGQLAGPEAAELAATLQAQGFVPRPLGDYAMVRSLLDDEWGRASSEPPGP
ncbi:MAG: PhnD/SsuA/transferrin family substrate-binding protein, partial [Deltaproteobacteria bacterium]